MISTQVPLLTPTASEHPTLHLRSWAYVRERRKRDDLAGAWALTIMADPRPAFGELGDGRVEVLIPQGREWYLMRRLVRLRRRGLHDPALLSEYRAALDERWSHASLGPGALHADTSGLVLPVRDGDHLCCACSAADALAGMCHRSWAAPHLVRSGWNVVMDGMRVVVEAT